MRVRLGMVLDLVAVGGHAAQQRRLAARRAADDEERCRDVLALELVEHTVGHAAGRAVVERQRDDVAGAVRDHRLERAAPRRFDRS